jgi:hypothetical protein
MKKKYLLCVFVFFGLKVFSQQIAWMDTISFALHTSAKNLSLDQNGNIYVTGNFGSNYCCSPWGKFCSKYNAAGTCLNWDTISVPFNTDIINGGIAADSQNNLYSVFRAASNFKMDNVIYSPQTYLIKQNSSGQVLWALPQNFEYPYQIITDVAGNVYVVYNGVTKKYNSSGALLYSYSGWGWIAVDASLNLYILSNTIRKFNANGFLIWTYSGIQPNSQFVVDPAGNCYLHEGNDPSGSYLRKINSQGQLAWTVPLWTTATGGICIYSNAVYVAGVSGNDNDGKNIEIRKADYYGNILWSFQIPVGSYMNPYYPVSIGANQDGLYIAAVKTQAMYSLLLKITEPEVPTQVKESKKDEVFSVYPNPSSAVFNVYCKTKEIGTVKLNVRDVLGNLVYTKEVKNPDGQLNEQINLSSFAKGVYILETTGSTILETRRLIVE